MSLRFRQRFKILPGIYFNLGMNGISTTIGPRGANINIGKQGIYLNTGIPGTGISNRQNLFGIDKPEYEQPDDITPPQDVNSEKSIPEDIPITTTEGLKGLNEQIEEAMKERAQLLFELTETGNRLNFFAAVIVKITFTYF